MRASALIITVFISVFLVAAAVPGALAEEAAPEAVEEELPEDAGDPSVAYGHVYVYVLEWSPDLEGAGAGLFTYSEFDFGEFFEKVSESLSSLFGL